MRRPRARLAAALVALTILYLSIMALCMLYLPTSSEMGMKTLEDLLSPLSRRAQMEVEGGRGGDAMRVHRPGEYLEESNAMQSVVQSKKGVTTTVAQRHKIKSKKRPPLPKMANAGHKNLNHAKSKPRDNIGTKIKGQQQRRPRDGVKGESIKGATKKGRVVGISQRETDSDNTMLNINNNGLGIDNGNVQENKFDANVDETLKDTGVEVLDLKDENNERREQEAKRQDEPEIVITEEISEKIILRNFEEEALEVMADLEKEAPLLSCKDHGGPDDDLLAEEMVYWKRPRGPFQGQFVQSANVQEQFVTFEPDAGQWNNKRMAFESAIAVALATNRTLVLPPKSILESRTRRLFQYSDYMTVDLLKPVLNVMSMTDFLSKNAHFPMLRRTNWDGADTSMLYQLLRFHKTTESPMWRFDECVVGLGRKSRMDALFRDALAHMPNNNKPIKPMKVDAPPRERLGNVLGHRKGEICHYTDNAFAARVLHLQADPSTGVRLLAPFYAFSFVEDWHLDLYIKRTIRDRIRYNDRLQCAAARIVAAMRKKYGDFDSMHVRRNDFVGTYPFAVSSAQDMYDTLKDVILDNSTVFIATDEVDREYFAPLQAHYNLLFLKDFVGLYADRIPASQYAMLDQLVASRGRVFAGAYYSTFTSYINRLRGYHKQKLGKADGVLDSYYYMPKGERNDERAYYAVHYPAWAREFPMAYVDIDNDSTKTGKSSVVAL